MLDLAEFPMLTMLAASVVALLIQWLMFAVANALWDSKLALYTDDIQRIIEGRRMRSGLDRAYFYMKHAWQSVSKTGLSSGASPGA
jgi:hypothetical protein